jgi:arylsulfatase A-like enzyme
MRPNIIFFLIDGLRADQCFGNDKTSFTPNINSLRKKGTYFTNAFSSVDGTGLSLSAIFNSLFPIKTPDVKLKLNLQKNNLFDILAKNGYEINGLVPALTSFIDTANYFENDIKTYDYLGYVNKMDQFLLNTTSSITDKIIDFLKSRTSKKSWFYYIHTETLHPLKEYFASYDNKRDLLNQGIKDFNNEKFGAGLYERTVSFIDHELGKILEHVDLDNTILILTSDHGQSIPYEGHPEVDFEPKLATSKKIGLKILPKTTHKVGGQFLYKMRKSVAKRKLNKANEKLTNYQKRSRESAYAISSLFDEMLHVPLLFAGNHINSSTVSDLVHHTDILPTLCELVNINLNQSIHGRNLVPLIEGNKIEEKPIYLRTRPYMDPKSNKRDSVGIRTSNYKYFRSTYNAKKNVHLYDLENDPYENNNIARSHKQLVARFENKILELQKDNLSKYKEKIPDEEIEEISNELYKMGYL